MTRFALLLLALCSLAGCAGEGPDAPRDEDDGGAAGETPSEEISEHGVGPVRSVTLGELDPAMAEEGEEVFRMKCYACHRMEDRYVGPALGDVLERHTPEYVMNMMLNPEGMLEEVPAAKALLAEFLVPMPNQNLTEAQARAVVEYLRTEATGSGGS